MRDEEMIMFVRLTTNELVYGDFVNRDNNTLTLSRPVQVDTQQGADGNLYYVAMRACHINEDEQLQYNESSIVFTTTSLPDYVKDFYHWAALYVYREREGGINVDQKEGFVRFASRLKRAVEEKKSLGELVDDVPQTKGPGTVNPDDLN